MLYNTGNPYSEKKHYTTLYLRKLGVILVNPYKNWNPDNTPLIAYKCGQRDAEHDGYYQNHELFIAIEKPSFNNEQRAA